MTDAIEREIEDIRQNLRDQLDLVDQLLGSLGLQTPDREDIRPLRDSEIVSEISDNLNDSDILIVLKIAYIFLKWPKQRSGLGDVLDLSDQYLETLGLTLSGILSDKLETL